MQTAESILVIIVSSVLTLFLIVAIIALLMIVKLIGSIKKMVERGEHALDKAGEAAEMLRQASGPLAIFRTVRSIVRMYR